MEQLISFVLNGTAGGLRHTARTSILNALGILLCAVALAFLTMGAFIVLMRAYDAAIAAFVIGLAYVVLALCIFAFNALRKEMRMKRLAAARAAPPPATALEAMARDIAQSGLKPTHLALLSGLPLLRDAKPMHLAMLSMLAGFVASKSMK